MRSDWLFTATTAVLQPLTGWWMMRRAGWPASTAWLAGSVALYALAMDCWLPVVRLQMRLRDMAIQASTAGAPLPPAFWRCFMWRVALGVPALLALLAVFWLMVTKAA